MTNHDEMLVAELVVEYYQWLTGHGGVSSDDLLSKPLSPNQRRMLLEGMNDVNEVFAMTAPIHQVAGTRPRNLKGD